MWGSIANPNGYVNRVDQKILVYCCATVLVEYEACRLPGPGHAVAVGCRGAPLCVARLLVVEDERRALSHVSSSSCVDIPHPATSHRYYSGGFSLSALTCARSAR
jgi:hypothetical protein